MTIVKIGPQQELKSLGAAFRNEIAAKDGNWFELEEADYVMETADISTRMNRIKIYGTAPYGRHVKFALIPFETTNKMGQKVTRSHPTEGKGILLTKGNDITVEGLSFAHAVAPYDEGVCGWRAQGQRNIARRCNFANNQDGFMSHAQPIGSGTLTWNWIDQCTGTGNGIGGGGKAHAIYMAPADINLATENHFTGSVDQGLLLKMHSGGGLQIQIGNRLWDIPGDMCSYQADMTNGPGIFAYNDVRKRDNTKLYAKSFSYNTVRDMTPPGGNEIYVFKNRWSCPLKMNGTFIAISNEDSKLDEGSVPEPVKGKVWANNFEAVPNPQNPKASYASHPIRACPGVLVEAATNKLYAYGKAPAVEKASVVTIYDALAFLATTRAQAGF